MAKQSLIVLSESQLFKTQSEDVSVKAFAEATGLSEYYIKAILLYDQYIAPCLPPVAPCMIRAGSYINQYKLGEIWDTYFTGGIRERLGQTHRQLPDEKVKECWNAMCTFNEQAKKECKEFVEFLQKNPNYHAVFVNETNALQHNYNLEQFQKSVDQEAYNQVSNRMYFINSHEIGCLGKSELILKGVPKLQSEQKIPQNNEIGTIISLHNAMPAKSILTEGNFAQSSSNRKYLDVSTKPQTDIPSAIEGAHNKLALRELH